METLIVALIIAAAALYVGRKGYHLVAASRRKHAGGCAGGCGCSGE